MRNTAKVFLRRPYVNLTIDVGQKHLPECPIVGELISFEHQGKTDNGIVEDIAGGVVPALWCRDAGSSWLERALACAVQASPTST